MRKPKPVPKNKPNRSSNAKPSSVGLVKKFRKEVKEILGKDMEVWVSIAPKPPKR